MQKNILVSERDFIVLCEDNSYEISISEVSAQDDIYVYELCALPLKENAGAVTVKWNYHMQGLLSTWCPVSGRRRQLDAQCKRCSNSSNLYYGAPIYAVINHDDTNFATLALSDAVNPSTIAFNVSDFEEKENLYYNVFLFEDWQPTTEYKLLLRVDERKIPYYETIPDVTKWWKNFYSISREQMQNEELPLYSTWYNFHQNPSEEKLLCELQKAAELGFKSVIIDDGWSYPGRGPGDYRFCGNWNVCAEKFPDFKGFVDKLHDMGLKVMLWFPVPFVGYETEEYKKFKDKLLYNGEIFKAGVLDPRYPEVRSFLVNTYKETVQKYGLDGLKLDFIDSFKCKEDLWLPDTGRDCKMVEEGVIKLMDDIKTHLTSSNPDFMLEQRQYYVGPALVGNCNMLRVLDCQFDFLTNRIGIADLRLMNYDLAVHADMLLWSHDETSENCARMLLNIMFGVPQISVLLSRTSEKNKQVIKNFIAYWYENKDVILHGNFKAYNPHQNYTKISCENDDKRVEVLYSGSSSVFDGKLCDIFNATACDFIYLENMSKNKFSADIYGCFGNLVNSICTDEALVKINVPVGGSLKVKERKI